MSRSRPKGAQSRRVLHLWGKGAHHKSNLTNSPSMDTTLVGVGDPGGPTTTNPSASTTDRNSSLKKRPPKSHKEARSRDSNFSSSRPLPPAPALPTHRSTRTTFITFSPRTSIANLNIHQRATRRAMPAREPMDAPVPHPEPDVVTMSIKENGVSIPTVGERISLQREPTKSE